MFTARYKGPLDHHSRHNHDHHHLRAATGCSKTVHTPPPAFSTCLSTIIPRRGGSWPWVLQFYWRFHPTVFNMLHRDEKQPFCCHWITSYDLSSNISFKKHISLDYFVRHNNKVRIDCSALLPLLATSNFLVAQSSSQYGCFRRWNYKLLLGLPAN